MADTFLLEIATPEKLVVANPATEAEIPGAGGTLGILPGHAALISEVEPGPLYYVMDGRRQHVAVGKGWVEVTQERVRVLVDTCESAEEIDTARAEAAFKRAAERLTTVKEDVDQARAVNAYKRAEARLAVAKQRTS